METCSLKSITLRVFIIKYSFSTGSVVSFNPCVGPLPRVKISVFLLSTCADELISAPNVITSLPIQLASGNKKLAPTSNSILQPEYLYLSGSASLFKLTVPNKEIPSVTS